MKAKIAPPTPEFILQVAQALKNDEVVGMPTETVYGLAGNARSAVALAKIFATKERPTFDPLIVHIGAFEAGLSAQQKQEALKNLDLVNLSGFSTERLKQLQTLIDRFWPGPLTLVLPKHPSVPDLATSGLPTVAIRMPEHPVALSLIEAAQTPLAAPSANRFGRISPTSAQAVQQELGDRISWILDGGPSAVGVESTILSLAHPDQLIVLRPGGTPPEVIESVLGVKLKIGYGPQAQQTDPHLTEERPLAPGMLESHYAPQTPLVLLPQPIDALSPKNLEQFKHQAKAAQNPDLPIGLLLIRGNPHMAAETLSRQLEHTVTCRSLSESGSLNEAARNLFAEMRYLDSLQLSVIFAEPCSEPKGLGFAISDRLRRASAKRTLD